MDIPNILNKIILESVTFCYPCKITERVKPENMGIFKPYYNVPLTKEQVDNLIYQMLKQNPCVDGAMGLGVVFYEHGTYHGERNCKSIYFSDSFQNYLVDNQTPGDLNVKFNFESEDEANL